MKILLRSYFFLFFIQTASAQTNVYHPFADSGAVWGQNYFYMCNASAAYENDFYSYVMTGDTVIGAFTYHKLEIPYLQHAGAGTLCPIATGYAGAIRNFTAAKQVMFVPPGNATEEILYNFNLQPGDTCHDYFTSMCSNGYTYVVSTIDSLLIGNNYRKRWFFPDAICPYYLIEGIGSTKGLLQPPCSSTAFDGVDNAITCYQENNVMLYSNPSFNLTNCDIIDEIKNIPVKISLTFHPNPFHESAQMQIFPAEIKIKNFILRIYNNMGMKIREEEILNNTSCIFHRDEMNKGMYFFELQTNNPEPRIGYGKFIIY